MAESFDVIVVGARCAGSPLATMLARQGVRVCVLDKARFPSEVPSTHFIQSFGSAVLRRIGVLDKLLAAGTPRIDRASFIVDDARLEIPPEISDRYADPWIAPRRVTLDALLVEAAEDAGVDVRPGTGVTGLVVEEGVVRGVRTEGGILRAPLVVGADGPHSLVARMAGAREYNAVEPGRLFVWGYYENADEPQGHVRLIIQRDSGYLAMPTDGGLYLAAAGVSVSERHEFLADLERNYAARMAQARELQDILQPARRVGKLRVMARWHGFFREATGPGWVLVGDAGHFKDPTPAQGIADALHQAEQLADVIEDGLGGGGVQRRLRDWWLQRDREAWEMYWFAHDIGAGGPPPAVITETFRSLSHSKTGPERWARVLNRELLPTKVFGPGLAMRALARVTATRPSLVPRLLSDLRDTVRDDRARRRLAQRPEYVTQTTTAAEPAAEAATVEAPL